jgi:predicted MPP superfamily phosphohydrolase
VSLFLLTFFLLYGALHFYAFLKARAALLFGHETAIYLAVFMAIMVFAPFIIRFMERSGLDFFARLMAYIGYIWLGILFLFCSYAFVIDLYRLLISFGGLAAGRDLSHLLLSARYAFFLPLLLSLATACYGYFEARNIRTERIIIRTSKIPAEIGTLKIVQISDVHLGLIVREDRLKRILDKVKNAHPDILVSTGDLVDGETCKLNGLSDLLKEIQPRYGKFAITGNHEFYAGLDQAKCFTENSGFRLLRGEAITVAGIINIAGVDDPAGNICGISKDISEKNLLSGLPRDKFTLFLKHRPLISKEAVGLFDLQLSGHVHKGQIFPFSTFTWFYYPVQAGFAGISGNSYLYVSRGAGTWGPPIRFLSPPEVAIIELVHDNRSKPD